MNGALLVILVMLGRLQDFLRAYPLGDGPSDQVVASDGHFFLRRVSLESKHFHPVQKVVPAGHRAGVDDDEGLADAWAVTSIDKKARCFEAELRADKGRDQQFHHQGQHRTFGR